jgi:hypothetical protein
LPEVHRGEEGLRQARQARQELNWRSIVPSNPFARTTSGLPRTARLLRALALAGCACACAAPARPAFELPRPDAQQSGPPPKFAELPRAGGRPVWESGTLRLQGFVGIGDLDRVTLDQGSTTVEIDAGEMQNFPVIGGGLQWKLAGERVDFGLEALFSVGWRANAVAFASSGGGALVALDVDTLFVDVYSGPFLSMFLGDHTRAYVAAGPALQFVDYTQLDAGNVELRSTGSGFGAYARAGIEFMLPGRDMIGLCVLRTDGEVQLGSDLGEFAVDSTQVVLTVTTGF